MGLNVVQHPLLDHKVTVLRDKETSPKKFRELVTEMTMLLAYEATRDLAVKAEQVQTPLTLTNGKILANPDIIIIPILRAGLGMVEGMLNLLPFANVFHLGLKRDETTFTPISYYDNIRNLRDKIVFVVDPMLATAGSLNAAFEKIKDHDPLVIKAVTIIASPEGKKKVEAEHPDVQIYTAALDERLNENAYIVPGLGDAGDRLFGTF